MDGITLEKEVGRKIRYYRKKKKLKACELAAAVNKSSASISKYENGQIAIDIVTLYEIADALDVPPEKLLYHAPSPAAVVMDESVPAFFIGVTRLYMYYFDGRNNRVTRTVIDIREKVRGNVYDVAMFMNFEDYDEYQNCEITYLGTLQHHGAVSNMILQNPDSEMDIYLVCVPAPYLNADTKWGQDFGISGRPIMPTSNKVFLSKHIMKEDAEFIKDLHVSKEDIRILKQYNMLSVL